MMKSRLSFALTSLFVFLLIGMSLAAFSAPPSLTGAQVLQRCRQAYDALQSYEGTSNVSSVGDINGYHTAFHTSAHIRFVRPGKIRVEGTLMTSGKFAFVSDGRSTWQAADFLGGQWQPAQSTEMAVAAFTGVAQDAATTIPALLLHLNWGGLTGAVSPSVAQETVAGHPTYRITIKNVAGEQVLWVDRKTFLLVQSRQVTDIAKAGKQVGQALRNATGTANLTETYANVRLNPPLPASLFTKPSGHL